MYGQHSKPKNIEISMGKLPEINIKKAYVFENGKYRLALGSEIQKFVPAFDEEAVEYYTPIQAKQINNLLKAKQYIDIEIENIKQGKNIPKDEYIHQSKLSPRAKNVCNKWLGKNALLSNLADVPLKDWERINYLGALTRTELKAYLHKRKFELIEE